MARASAGLTDGTIRGDVGRLEQIRTWFGCPPWDMELRRRSCGNDITHTQHNVVRQRLRAAVYPLDWLAEQDLTPASCRQSDLERWMTRDQTQLRGEAGHFVRWTLVRRITATSVSRP